MGELLDKKTFQGTKNTALKRESGKVVTASGCHTPKINVEDQRTLDS